MIDPKKMETMKKGKKPMMPFGKKPKGKKKK